MSLTAYFVILLAASISGIVYGKDNEQASSKTDEKTDLSTAASDRFFDSGKYYNGPAQVYGTPTSSGFYPSTGYTGYSSTGYVNPGYPGYNPLGNSNQFYNPGLGGYSGYSGLGSGYSGLGSGYSGLGGGYSGYNGYNGYSGIGSGYSGIGSGYNGYGGIGSGYSGTGSGYYGATGYSGSKGYGGYGGYGGNGGLASYSGYNNPYYLGQNNLGFGYNNKNGVATSYYNRGVGLPGYAGVTPGFVSGYRGYS